MYDTPLGKPQGTVRAWLALSLLWAVLVAYLGSTGILLLKGQYTLAVDLVKFGGVLLGPVLGFYYGSRKASAQ